MNLKSLTLAAAGAALLAASPAAAVVQLRNVNFGGSINNTNAATVTRTVQDITFTAEARIASGVLPSALTLLSQISTVGQVRVTTPGIGVTGGASTEQLDTNSATRREGILITSNSGHLMRLHAATLSFVDNDDTLAVYGVRGTQLVYLGYPGVIRQGLTGPNAALSLLNGQATGSTFAAATNSGQQSFTLVNPTDQFSAFFFTTREPGETAYLGTLGQGYRINSLTISVPEPGTWLMLVLGFGMVGIARRRIRTTVTA